MIFNSLNRIFSSHRISALKLIKRFNSQTIYSLSSNIKPTGSAIAVIRISGHKSCEALSNLIENEWKLNKCISNPRKAIFTKIYDKKQNELLDSSIVIFFKKPFSYTGEDMCEFHVHGSNAVINGVLGALSRIDGLRPAQSGEFTKRALINNKLDLIEVEAINDLIRAQTDSQRRRALTGVSGSVTKLYEVWREQTIQLMANIEVLIDFGEEELIDGSVFNNIKNQMNDLKTKIIKHSNNCKNKSQLIKDGLKVVIIGAPNVGKSSLINKLCERQLSIVSPISGTTRDIVETWLNINGYSVSVSDTAGIRYLDSDSDNSIEKEGIRRAIERAQTSDLIVFVVDSTTFFEDNFNQKKLEPNYLKEIIDSKMNRKLFYLFNKIDLISEQNYNYLQKYCNKCLSNWSAISCKTSIGFDQFTQKFIKTVEQLCGNPLSETLFSSVRHESHLNKVVQQIQLAIESLDKDIAVSGHHLREAAQQLSYITGRITTEDVLDVIFRDFCIGK